MKINFISRKFIFLRIRLNFPKHQILFPCALDSVYDYGLNSGYHYGWNRRFE